MEKKEKTLDLTNVISTAIQLPGVKVSRDVFLKEQFKELTQAEIDLILQSGPVEAGVSREILARKAKKIIRERSAVSSGASFLAGLPGGIAMAATIPADLLQFYGVALRMAQELVYLYGEADMWCDNAPDPDKITNQLILYCGVMLGVTGAAQTVRIMSSALAKQALKKLPQKALTKTFYYPVIKSILKFFGVSVTKSTFAKGVSKVIPVIGGVVSGGITLASMIPMGNRLSQTLDQTHFEYSTREFQADMQEIESIQKQYNTYESTAYETGTEESTSDVYTNDAENAYSKIKKAKQMFEDGLITKEDFDRVKEKYLSQL